MPASGRAQDDELQIRQGLRLSIAGHGVVSGMSSRGMIASAPTTASPALGQARRAPGPAQGSAVRVAGTTNACGADEVQSNSTFDRTFSTLPLGILPIRGGIGTCGREQPRSSPIIR